MARTGSTRRLRAIGWLVTPAVLVVAWEVSARWVDAPYVYPTATAVLARLARPSDNILQRGSLGVNTAISLMRVILGFAAAAVAGVAAGLVMGASRVVRAMVEPVVELLRPLCPVAWVPFAIAVFGMKTVPGVFGFEYTDTLLDEVQVGTVFVLFWGAFFPIVINTLDGVARVRQSYVKLAWTLGASRWRIFRHVHLPGAMPGILTGLRQGVGTCWFVIIAAEMLPGSDSGIGYLLLYSAEQLAMDVTVAALIVIAAIGAVLNAAMVAAMHSMVSWQGKET